MRLIMLSLLKKLIVPAMVISLVSAPCAQAKPTTSAGKIAASALQTINRHPFYTSCVLTACIALTLKVFTNIDSFQIPFMGIFGCSIVLETGSKALMKNFEIEQLPA